MTTRQELIEGIQMIIREGLRTTQAFSADDWGVQVHDDEGGGWNRKQIYAHLTSTAEVAPAFLGALGNAPAGQDAAAGLDIAAFNAQQVAAKEALGPDELLAAFKSANERLIEHVRGMPDDLLAERRRFGALEGTVAEIMDSVLVLHGLAHIYYASTRAFV